MKSFLEASNKPKDWSVNNREALLENIYNALERYGDNPSFRTKEVVVSLAVSNGLNQRSYFGMFRISEFEVQLMNIIYTMSFCLILFWVRIHPRKL